MKQNKLFCKDYTVFMSTRIIALLLAAMLMLACFSACGTAKQLPNVNNGDWSSDVASKKEEQQSNKDNTTNGNKSESAANTSLAKDISILSIESPSEGSAVIMFSMDSITYYGIVNAKGKIIYYSENPIEMYNPKKPKENIIWTPAGNGCGFLNAKNDKNQYVFTIFNEDGDITMTVTEGDAFDKIIGFGDGVLLVYKNTSAITTQEHLYGVFTCDGDWTRSLTPGYEWILNDRYNYDGSDYYEYLGRGVFMSFNTYRNIGNGYGHYKIFDTNDYKFYDLSDCTIPISRQHGVSNGTNYGYARTDSTVMCTDILEQQAEERTGLPMYFAFNADGTVEEVPAFTAVFDNLLINTYVEYMYIFNRKNNIKKEYTIFPCNMIRSVKFDGDYGILILNGADGKDYFTVIDKECNEIVEPICCSEAVISDGRIVYESDGSYYVLNTDGKYIIDNSQGYTYISGFSCGIAKATKGNEEFLIDLNGNPIAIKMK